MTGRSVNRGMPFGRRTWLPAVTGLIAGLACATASSGVDLPRESRVPGGIAIIELGAAAQPPGEVFFDGHRAPVLPGPSGWVALIGIPLATPPGPQSAEFVPAGE